MKIVIAIVITIIILLSIFSCNKKMRTTSIVLNGNEYLTLELGSAYEEDGAKATDILGNDITNDIEINGSVDINKPGTYIITYAVIDSNNKKIVKEREVKIVDTTKPTITFEANGDDTAMQTHQTMVTVSDIGGVNLNCLKYLWSNSLLQPKEQDFALKFENASTIENTGTNGIYYLWILAKDESGNTSIVKSNGFNFNYVFSTNTPTLTLLGSSSVTIGVGSNYIDAGAIASDPIDGVIIPRKTTNLNVNQLGTYYVKYTATNEAGRKLSKTRTINVVDTTKPVITLNGSSTFVYPQTEDLYYSELGYTVTDNVDGNITNNVIVTGAIDFKKLGAQVLTYKVSDSSGNIAIVTRTYNIVRGNNAPVLAEGMTPIKWDGTTWVDTTETDVDWYSYMPTDKKWANARTTDDSMWVWIPRFAYRIDSGFHSNEAGDISIVFLQGTTNKTFTGLNADLNPTYIERNQTNFIVHPAFNFNAFDTSGITGLWVAKFETSGSIDSIAYKPNVSSLRTVNIDDMFMASINLNNDSKFGLTVSGETAPHMMNNVEWGAVAYLTQSRYGKNSEVWINPSSDYITGCAGNGVSASSSPSCSYTYETSNGQQASTTGNINGIYDMSGGALEYVSAYIDNQHPYQELYGGNVILSSYYGYTNRYDAYTEDPEAVNYLNAEDKFGDALFETSFGEYSDEENPETWHAESWYGDDATMPTLEGTFFRRGGLYSDGEKAGLFAFFRDSGIAYQFNSWRTAISVDKSNPYR